MTSFVAPTIVGWSEKAVEEYRGVVAPLRGNFWNKVDNQLTGKFALVYVIIGIGGFSFGLLFNQQFPVLGGIGIGLFILLYLLSTLSSKYKAKPAVWNRVALAAFLDQGTPNESVEKYLKEAIDAEHRRNPGAQFEVEYLASATDSKSASLPQTLILWSRPSLIFAVGTSATAASKSWAILALKNGVYADLTGQSIAYPPVA